MISEAVGEYERACRLAPSWSVPFYDLGLHFKYEGDWVRSFELNLRAAELDPEDQAGWWNLGIAATALGRWEEARRAWRGAGLEVPEGEGPLDHPCGYGPVRLNPDTDGEVVWCDRLDPARALIRNIPLVESGFRYGDIVLNDGAPNGYRLCDGVEVPVLDCLALLVPSVFSTWVVEAEIPVSPDEAETTPIEALKELAEASSLSAEDWSTSIRVLCKACSEGRPDPTHTHGCGEERDRRIAIAAPTQGAAEDLMDRWVRQSQGVEVRSLELGLGGRSDSAP
ncbi:MAG: tetratricopeptide repeat protein [Acidobacteria bacterium]|nr:tetratricopeptide repeat protein [Acidobacteriota bacterium]